MICTMAGCGWCRGPWRASWGRAFASPIWRRGDEARQVAIDPRAVFGQKIIHIHQYREISWHLILIFKWIASKLRTQKRYGMILIWPTRCFFDSNLERDMGRTERPRPRSGQNRLLQTEPAEVSQRWSKSGVMVKRPSGWWFGTFGLWFSIYWE